MARTTHQTRFVLSAKDKTRAAFKSVRGNLAGMGRGVTGLQTQLLGLAGIGGIGFLAKKLIDVNAEFQTIKSSLKTMTGGTKEAAEAFELITEFATETPFDLQQVTQSFIKLKALGLDPSSEALRSYGNTASAMGKSLDQMIEAVADAATGEFERLKEFGIKAKKQGDEVTFTFQGVETTVKNSSENIQGYLRGIGDVNFSGAMADQMKNLTPAFDNFQTAINLLAVKVGEAGVNEAISEMVNNTTAWIESLDSDAVAKFAKDVLGYFGDIGDAVGFVTDSIARTVQLFESGQIFGGLGPAGAGIPGGDPNYKLGDFNRANPTTFADFASQRPGVITAPAAPTSFGRVTGSGVLERARHDQATKSFADKLGINSLQEDIKTRRAIKQAEDDLRDALIENTKAINFNRGARAG